jgi:hypothetical protein
MFLFVFIGYPRNENSIRCHEKIALISGAKSDKTTIVKR